MGRHPQMTRQQMTDQLDATFAELEAWDKLIADLVDPTVDNWQVMKNAAYVLDELQTRIRVQLDLLSEYK